jgi:hypothetical protein
MTHKIGYFTALDCTQDRQYFSEASCSCGWESGRYPHDDMLAVCYQAQLHLQDVITYLEMAIQEVAAGTITALGEINAS